VIFIVPPVPPSFTWHRRSNDLLEPNLNRPADSISLPAYYASCYTRMFCQRVWTRSLTLFEAIMDIKTVGVIGAGTMGNGIAHVFAKSGYNVVLVDVEQRFVDRGLQTISKNLEREVAKGKLTAEQRDQALGRIAGTTDRNRLADCDFIVEAASERFEIKAELFRDLDAMCRPEVLLSSNTSSISITKLAAVTKRPDKVIGMHFFNPVPVMKLVELIRGLATSNETFATVKALAEKLEKTPVEVNDAPGFVSNRVLMPLLNEAMYAVMEGVATAEAVDEVFKLGMAHPMGPLTLADFIGLDVCLDIMRVMQSGLGDPKYRPCPLLIKMVDAGWLGRKSGRGFYQY
jgi:3-hydroxybutyryl-CoA dehydrogenase